jgi:molybdate transport system regulatory protein
MILGLVEEPNVVIKPAEGLSIKSRVWIEDANGDVVFGVGRLRILDEVDRLGSLHAASKSLRMSYRAVWGKIRATEERLGQPLLSRKTGGAEGGGSELTAYGKAVLARFRDLQARTEANANVLFHGLFAEDVPCGDAGDSGEGT